MPNSSMAIREDEVAPEKLSKRHHAVITLGRCTIDQ